MGGKLRLRASQWSAVLKLNLLDKLLAIWKKICYHKQQVFSPGGMIYVCGFSPMAALALTTGVAGLLQDCQITLNIHYTYGSRSPQC